VDSATVHTFDSTDVRRDGRMREAADAFSEKRWHSACSDGHVPPTAPLPIAVAMTSFDPGGTERQMIELVRRLDRGRWDVHIACFHTRGAWFDRVAAIARVQVFPVTSFRKLEVARQLRAFAAWCRARAIQVVHTADTPANIFGLPGAALAGVPVRIGNRRDINPGRSGVQIALQRAAYSCAHVVVANTRAAAARLRFERVPAAKIAVVPNGLDCQSFTRQDTTRHRLRHIVVVANLRPEKGHDVLIDAAVHVLRTFPDARFEFVGSGPERDRLLTLANSRGVGHAFDFVGHQDDVAARLAAADIFVLPSRSEAFPNAVLEAMAAGLPVVASDVGGIPDLVDDGRTGVLVPAGDPRALSDRICRLIGDPAYAASLGNAGRADVEARYSFERMVTAFEALYLSELARRGVIAAGRPQFAAS
jgi:glycosyltransferase involved in cell wall biosynthesis